MRFRCQRFFANSDQDAFCSPDSCQDLSRRIQVNTSSMKMCLHSGPPYRNGPPGRGRRRAVSTRSDCFRTAECQMIEAGILRAGQAGHLTLSFPCCGSRNPKRLWVGQAPWGRGSRGCSLPWKGSRKDHPSRSYHVRISVLGQTSRKSASCPFSELRVLCTAGNPRSEKQNGGNYHAQAKIVHR